MAQTHRVVSEYKLPDNPQSNIRVFVRVRPLEDGNALGDFIKRGSDDHREIVIKDPESSNRQYSEVSFQFDKVFWTDVGQEEIFNSMCKSQLEHVLEGFNTCCFAYGQTGSGKTYSMFGGDDEIRGLIPRSAEFLFHNLSKKQNSTETAVVCSFLEIYNDQIRDLGKAYLVSIGAVENTSTAMFNKTSAIFESLAGKRGNPYYAPAFHNNHNSNCNNSPTKVNFEIQVIFMVEILPKVMLACIH
jgi:Kinesin motor domain